MPAVIITIVIGVFLISLVGSHGSFGGLHWGQVFKGTLLGLAVLSATLIAPFILGYLFS